MFNTQPTGTVISRPWESRQTNLHVMPCHFLIADDNNNRIQRRNLRFSAMSSLCCEPSPTLMLKWPRRNRVQITCNTSSACHVQHVVVCATWYEGTAELLSLTELKLHLFELYYIGWTINQWRKGGNWSTWRKPLATNFRKCHIQKPEDSSSKRNSNPQNSIGGRLGKQTCKQLHHTSPPMMTNEAWSFFPRCSTSSCLSWRQVWSITWTWPSFPMSPRWVNVCCAVFELV